MEGNSDVSPCSKIRGTGVITCGDDDRTVGIGSACLHKGIASGIASGAGMVFDHQGNGCPLLEIQAQVVVAADVFPYGIKKVAHRREVSCAAAAGIDIRLGCVIEEIDRAHLKSTVVIAALPEVSGIVLWQVGGKGGPV